MGAKRGVETSLIPQSGFDGTFVSVTGISRKLSLRALKFVTQQFLQQCGRDSVSTLERESSRLSRRLRKSPGGDRAVVTRRPIIVVSYDRTLAGRAGCSALVNRNAGGVRGLAASKGCGRWCPTKALDTFGRSNS